jgi:hypothetical protein
VRIAVVRHIVATRLKSLQCSLGAIFGPWLLYPAVGALSESISVAKVWDGLWPLIVGAALALGLWRWGDRLPRLPEGDTVAAVEAACKASFSVSHLFDRVDTLLRQWPAASLSLLAIALILAAMAGYGG